MNASSRVELTDLELTMLIQRVNSYGCVLIVNREGLRLWRSRHVPQRLYQAVRHHRASIARFLTELAS